MNALDLLAEVALQAAPHTASQGEELPARPRLLASGQVARRLYFVFTRPLPSL